MKPLVVITGASSGIGAATANTFSEAGHPLLLVSRRLERMENLKLPNSLARSVDVLDVKSFAEAVSEAETLYGPFIVPNQRAIRSGVSRNKFRGCCVAFVDDFTLEPRPFWS